MTDYPEDKAAIWFEQSDAVDSEIAERFGAHLDAIAATDWHFDTLTSEAQIGLIIALDQFPRNIYRNNPQAFAYDDRARGIASALVAAGIERFRLVERMFLYLPFEHSEALADQDLSVRCTAICLR
jgi:uncharacterized protein (DUF924 family)